MVSLIPIISFLIASTASIETNPPAFAPLSYTSPPADATGTALLPLPAIPLGSLADSGDGQWGGILTIHSLVQDVTDAKVVPLIALYVPAGSPPTPFLPEGPFEGTFTGIMQFETAGEYAFYAEGRGEILVDVHEEIVLSGSAEDLSTLVGTPKHFELGYHPYTITFKSLESGASRFRLYWASSGIPKEPIPPDRLYYYWETKELAEGLERRMGRDLFAERRCHKCHALPSGIDAESGMPELAMDAPALDGVAAKYSTSWLTHWIADPRSYRESSTMPTGLATREEARDIVAYLQSLTSQPADNGGPSLPAQSVGSSESNMPAAQGDLIARGEALYREQECGACHLFEGFEKEGDFNHLLDLNRLSEKWTPQSLSEFLVKPEKDFAWTAMPNFGLSKEESQALAAFLLNPSRRTEVAVGAETVSGLGDPERGKSLLESKRCLNCHALEGKTGQKAASPISSWDPEGLNQGCLYSSPLGTEDSLHHGFSQEEIESLRVFIRKHLDSLNQGALDEFADRQLKGLRCLNCHSDPRLQEVDTIEDFTPFTQFFSRSLESPGLKPEGEAAEEDFEDYWDEEIEDATPTESEHQTRPYLTWAGEKLQSAWTEALLAGTLPDKPRPLLPARMPSFPARAREMALGMERLHGITQDTAEPEESSDLLAVGNLILGDEGFKCRSCHPLGDAPSLSGDQGASINLDLAGERLRYPFFERLIRSPQRVLPGTPMPQFILPDGTTPLSASLELETATQIQALWQALLSLISSSEDRLP